jgi:hypothetical protein
MPAARVLGRCFFAIYMAYSSTAYIMMRMGRGRHVFATLQRPSPAIGRHHRKGMYAIASREAACSGVGVVQRRGVDEVQAPQQHGQGGK